MRWAFDIRQASRQLALVLALTAGAELGFWLLFTRAKVREYTALSVGTAPQQVELAQRREAVESVEAYQQALEQAQTNLTRLRQEILATRSQRMIAVQLELNELCGRFGIDLDSVTFDNEILEEEELDKLLMTLPLEGGYANLRKFLQAVEESKNFLVVEQVALSEARQGGVLLELSITLATYFDAPELRARAAQRRGTRPPRSG